MHRTERIIDLEAEQVLLVDAGNGKLNVFVGESLSTPFGQIDGDIDDREYFLRCELETYIGRKRYYRL